MKKVKLFEQFINEGAFVVYYEDEKGKHLLGTFHNRRAAEKYKKEEEDEVLNTAGVEGIGTMSKDMWDKKEAPYIKESLNERAADYQYLVDLMLNADLKYDVYYNPSWRVVNVGGTGYDKGDLVKQFGAKPGQSSNIKDNFYLAAQNPKETIKQIEKISKGKIEVEQEGSLLKYRVK